MAAPPAKAALESAVAVPSGLRRSSRVRTEVSMPDYEAGDYLGEGE